VKIGDDEGIYGPAIHLTPADLPATASK
jgi:hypothetical protein